MKSVLGVRIDGTDKIQVLNVIEDRVTKGSIDRPLFIVTAYSETILTAYEDKAFAEILEKAYVVADGVSVMAALEGMNLGSISKTLRGDYKNRPVGVELARQILGKSEYKKFLLGGFAGVAEKLGEKYGCGWDEGEVFDKSQILNPKSQINSKVINKINAYKPDVLLVAYGRVKQEKWIAANLHKLKCKVVIGVGSSFDEIAQVGVWKRPVPDWVNRMGLKWLWRLIMDPGHIGRVWRAIVVFPWKVMEANSYE